MTEPHNHMSAGSAEAKIRHAFKLARNYLVEESETDSIWSSRENANAVLAIDAAEMALAALIPVVAQQAPEPVAYWYERATARTSSGKPALWQNELTFGKPDTHEFIRNVRPLYAAQPPAAPVEGGEVVWRQVNGDPFEYAIQQGPHGDEFVKLLNGSCLRRPLQSCSAGTAPVAWLSTGDNHHGLWRERPELGDGFQVHPLYLHAPQTPPQTELLESASNAIGALLQWTSNWTVPFEGEDEWLGDKDVALRICDQITSLLSRPNRGGE